MEHQTELKCLDLKRTFVVGTATTHIEITQTDGDNATDPFITGGSSCWFYFIILCWCKNYNWKSLDQNVEVTYVDIANNRLHLNTPLAVKPSNGTVINIIANRPTPLIGLKCRDFITSSQGRTVRNRTQVYPTRLSTGSDALIKVDLLKTPIFQTESVISGSVALQSSI